ncbi:hypothetical protein VT98_11623 [Candidatus Electrothrix communis]|uniref:Uncharacterized protein n=1 Tax=Candidatus Electrothrix communis TaxID=1859133 RepID=A0A3S3UC07_9BACT|nr:hypothetical protein VT98_11623 [Candidatus Electrothrix communis]
MNAYISFEENVASAERSSHLIKLADLIEVECDLSVKRNKSAPQQGEKDGGLTIGLTVAGLVLTGIGTLIAALSYWKSQQPKCSISITRGNVTVVIENIPPDQLRSEVAKLEKEESSSEIKVLVSEV